MYLEFSTKLNGWALKIEELMADSKAAPFAMHSLEFNVRDGYSPKIFEIAFKMAGIRVPPPISSTESTLIPFYLSYSKNPPNNYLNLSIMELHNYSNFYLVKE